MTNYLDKPKAAARLGVSIRTVERYASHGLLKRYRAPVGKKIYFDQAEIDELMVTVVPLDEAI